MTHEQFGCVQMNEDFKRARLDPFIVGNRRFTLIGTWVYELLYSKLRPAVSSCGEEKPEIYDLQ